MDTPATYLHWAFILISVPNLIVLAVMVILFIAALVVPFPHGDEEPSARRGDTLRGSRDD